MKFRVNACTAQHIGDRAEQQDRVAIFRSEQVAGCMLAILADGMGGKTGGALAAQQVLETAKNLFTEYTPRAMEAETLLRNIAYEAHTVIKLTAMSSEKEPHSTMVLLLLRADRIDWAHIGDSRLYHFQGPDLASRTIDHTFAETMVREGKLNPEEARRHRLAGVLTSALGGQKDPEISFGGLDYPSQNDRFLLCTDGIWAHFNERELGHTLQAYEPRKAAEIITENARARAKGHGDNASMVIIKLDPR
ncbi:PP2C family protein-serine/threonine phosphatase [Parvibium lacunae]|uniref:Serine/threonine-protein phosphatase n=1 Tax=Parvibium lacunae TaxID=1888893 RepID=A0A368L3M8_9BURK|nr:protein phosphatase 2C domain-containing protein [Parvibium lacunae]RCS58187.1 serine/threonine-protein phosphatase [Parvibium lacunae]